ncbi:MAG: 23S rRNA pseudouridine(955/2504/2580) synthase RluC [Gammaproteobacteria bacterium]|nr:23S rRNA pseudouridine(955/2504/2580) synthase RluC [Gammaproteobacteria bacterium]MDH5778490.1 23S rRNA pseudouridine(955/2504/2580) synthase RluC [Gammaproteobacteria bacterium]
MGNSKENKAHSVQYLEIDDDQAGQRIDNFLLSRLKGAPKSLIYRIVRKGEVRVNKGRIKPDYRLQAGDLVRVPPVRLGAEQQSSPAEHVLSTIENSILFEDKRILILNKPSGMAVHGGSGLSYGVIEGLRASRPDAPYLELVHRLDRDTSGCLLIAKKRSALRQLHELMRTNAITKQYLCLVMGEWTGGDRRIDVPLMKNVLKSGERVVRVNKEGKQALSLFRPIQSKPIASLMKVKLETGRTHQIRVHAAHEGFPIAGDTKYGDEAFNKLMKKHGLKRLFLHASHLKFELSEEAQSIDITAPLPDELQQVLSNIDLRY